MSDILDIAKKAHNIKYEPENIEVIFKDGKIEKVESSFVTDLMIEKNYETDYFPIIRLSLNIRPELYTKMVKEKETVKLRLSVKKLLYTKNNEFIKFEKYFNDVFCFFINDSTPLLDKDNLKDMHKAQGETTPSDFKNVYTFYLFKEKELSACKTILNDVLSGTIVDIVAYVMQKIGLSKVLMSKPDNSESIDNLLIPALNVVDTFKYIDQKKGIYNKGLLLFFDIDCIFFIDKNFACNAWRPNESRQTFINVFRSKSDYNLTPGAYIDSDKKINYLFSNANSVDIRGSAIITNQIDGNDMVLITPSQNKKTTYKRDLPNRGGNNTKIYVSEDNNKYFNNAENMRRIENDCVITISFVDTDISTLSPNKEFVIKFEDSEVNKKYGGKYRISKFLTIFKKEGTNFSSLTNCEFKRQSIS